VEGADCTVSAQTAHRQRVRQHVEVSSFWFCAVRKRQLCASGIPELLLVATPSALLPATLEQPRRLGRSLHASKLILRVYDVRPVRASPRKLVQADVCNSHHLSALCGARSPLAHAHTCDEAVLPGEAAEVDEEGVIVCSLWCVFACERRRRPLRHGCKRRMLATCCSILRPCVGMRSPKRRFEALI
jgi:hypothetical protein